MPIRFVEGQILFNAGQIVIRDDEAPSCCCEETTHMAPWSYFPRDREAVAELLATHCQPCPELSRAGCERVPWPCKRWSLWKQTVLVGWCKRWGERAVDGSR